MFLSILLTVIILVTLANLQMTNHFQAYLAMPHGDMSMQNNTGIATGMGMPEQIFLDSIHRSLFWVGGVILGVGLIASYLLSRSITVPLRRLSSAVEEIRCGQYGRQVNVSARDEVGKLINAFNEMSESLAAGVQQRRRLLADIAHELRTPLAVIQGNLEGMLDGVVEKSEEQIGSLYEETLHLNRMITELRDLSLAEAGQLRLEMQPVDLKAILHRAVTLLEPLAEEKGIVLVEDLAELPVLSLDIGRMNQVLYNLMSNALRYTPQGGQILLRNEVLKIDKREWVRIAVQDTGVGIGPEDLPHVFEHFYRSDKSRDKKSGGSGIGLAIVKQLTELHGGYVEVSSIQGQGSIFYVYLPVQAEV